jgi:hypothetical protein
MAKVRKNYSSASNGAVFLAFVGALIYFVQQASGFWEVILGFLKACVWPALVTYHLLEFLKL